MLQFLKQFAKGYLIGVALVIVVFLVANAHCSVGNKHVSSIGVPMAQENPLMYMAGRLSPQDPVSNIEGNLNLRINPLGTYMLFDESVLLCGMPTDKLRGVTEPFVLVYERIARRSVQGVGCHVLVGAYSLVPKGAE